MIDSSQGKEIKESVKYQEKKKKQQPQPQPKELQYVAKKPQLTKIQSVKI